MSQLLIFSMAFAFSSPLFAQLNSVDQEALDKTQQLLVNPAERNKAIGNDPKAKAADEQARGVGGAHTEDIYRISAQVFAQIVKDANGDPNKMMEYLEKMKSDPRAFYDSLSADQKKQIEALGKKIDSSNSRGPSAK